MKQLPLRFYLYYLLLDIYKIIHYIRCFSTDTQKALKKKGYIIFYYLLRLLY